jgi:uncharacterized protein YaiI (UPF0178 family)
MPIIYVDADACPVKDEIYRVAGRYDIPVKVVAKVMLTVPINPHIEIIVRSGFGEVDNWIATKAAPGAIVVTSDIPLAARCLEKGARVLSPKGEPFTDNDIGSALATRALMDELRQGGAFTGGPAPMTPKDRSRFLGKLDELIHAARRDATNEPGPKRLPT